MQLLNATLIKKEKLSENIFLFSLKIQETENITFTSGQFVNIYLRNETKLLPRPFGILSYENNVLEICFEIQGDGTKELSEYEIDTKLKCMLPLGNGFPEIDDTVLIGGGLGIVPLAPIKNNLIAFLGYKDKPFLAERFSNAKVITESEGLITDLIREYDFDAKTVFICGSKNMMNAVMPHLTNCKKIYASLEERLGCGFGACVGCSIKTKHGLKKICKDGPVFDLEEIEL